MQPQVDQQFIANISSAMHVLIFSHPLIVANKKYEPSISPDELANVLSTVVVKEIITRLNEARKTHPEVRAVDIATDPEINDEISEIIDKTIESYLVPISSSIPEESASETVPPVV